MGKANDEEANVMDESIGEDNMMMDEDEDDYDDDWGDEDDDWGDGGDEKMDDDGNNDEWSDDGMGDDDDDGINAIMQVADEMLIDKFELKATILQPKEVVEMRTKVLEEWGELMGIDNLEEVAVLCHSFGWQLKMCLEAYSENPEETLIERGLNPEKPSEMPFIESGETLCQICYCPCNAETECGWLKCKHQVCEDCWSHWLKAEMESKGPSAVMSKCPVACNMVIHTNIFERFLPQTMKHLYHKHLLNNFVTGSPT